MIFFVFLSYLDGFGRFWRVSVRFNRFWMVSEVIVFFCRSTDSPPPPDFCNEICACIIVTIFLLNVINKIIVREDLANERLRLYVS